MIFSKSRDVICFIIGGVTFEEEFHIYRLNKELQGSTNITHLNLNINKIKLIYSSYLIYSS